MQSRARKVVAGFLLVIGGVVLAVSSVGWWAEGSFLSENRFTDKADQILDEGDVQAALTQVLVRQLSRASGTDLQLAEPFLASVVQQVVQSGVFRTVFDAAVSEAHHVLVTRGSTDFVVKLARSYDEIKNTIEQVAPRLAAQLPGERELNIVVLKHDELSAVYDTIDLVKRIVVVLTVVGLVLIAAGIAVAPRRWRALALAGFVIVGTSAFLVVVLVIGRAVLHSRIDDPVYADAARSIFAVLTRGLVIQSVVIAVGAALVALAARFTDRYGLEAWPRATRRVWAWIVVAVPLPALDDDRAGLPPELAAAPGAVLTRLRLPEPRRQVRRQHIVRALVLLLVGLIALFDTAVIVTGAVILFGVAALYFAVVEGLAAWRAPKQGIPGPAAETRSLTS